MTYLMVRTQLTSKVMATKCTWCKTSRRSWAPASAWSHWEISQSTDKDKSINNTCKIRILMLPSHQPYQARQITRTVCLSRLQMKLQSISKQFWWILRTNNPRPAIARPDREEASLVDRILVVEAARLGWVAAAIQAIEMIKDKHLAQNSRSMRTLAHCSKLAQWSRTWTARSTRRNWWEDQRRRDEFRYLNINSNHNHSIILLTRVLKTRWWCNQCKCTAPMAAKEVVSLEWQTKEIITWLTLQMGPQERCKTKATQSDQTLKFIAVEEHMVTQISLRSAKEKKVQTQTILDKMLCKYLSLNF